MKDTGAKKSGDIALEGTRGPILQCSVFYHSFVLANV